jgi:hypothetical protein
MKKILLIVGLFSLAMVGRSQTVLNEVYGNPGGSNSEFVELYNSAFSTQNVDCFTLLHYYEDGANKGWYVLDLPNATIASKGWYTIAPVTPFSVQGTTGAVADLNWNDINFRNGSTGGYLQQWQAGVGSFTNVTPANNVVITNLLDGTLAGNQNYITLLFQNGVLINGFWGGGPSGVLPADITSMPDLTLTPAGACGAAFTIDFSTLPIIEFFNPAGGNDNGYARSSDGKCGAWVKTAPQINHTPGLSNGSATGLSGSLVTSPEILKCNVGAGISRVIYSITGVSGDASEAADFPVDIQLYYDFGTLGQLDGADVLHAVKIDNLISDDVDSFTIQQTQPVILVYKTQRGCFDKVVAIANGCAPLPVHFKSFTAVRSRSTVNLKWETTFEQNSDGFAVERNIGGVWQEIAYVPSQAVNGTSDALLTYTYNDLNSNKGMTQYRIRQVDLDGKAKNSEIRAVRGDGQLGTTVVYPNPTSDGKVTVVFEESNVQRDISLIDMTGRVIRQWKGVTNNNIQIDNLTPGVFSVRIIVPATGEQSVEKIVVNKR